MKNIGLVAHDNRKADLLEWVAYNREKLIGHHLICTGTTGKLVEEDMKKSEGGHDITITRLKSGPLGGDQQLGAMISEGKVDALIFFWDPMSAQPHDVDVKALLRITVLYNVVTATNRSTADFVISSRLFDGPYEPALKDYSGYIMRNLPPDGK